VFAAFLCQRQSFSPIGAARPTPPTLPSRFSRSFTFLFASVCTGCLTGYRFSSSEHVAKRLFSSLPRALSLSFLPLACYEVSMLPPELFLPLSLPRPCFLFVPVLDRPSGVKCQDILRHAACSSEHLPNLRGFRSLPDFISFLNRDARNPPRILMTRGFSGLSLLPEVFMIPLSWSEFFYEMSALLVFPSPCLRDRATSGLFFERLRYLPYS